MSWERKITVSAGNGDREEVFVDAFINSLWLPYCGNHFVNAGALNIVSTDVNPFLLKIRSFPPGECPGMW